MTTQENDDNERFRDIAVWTFVLTPASFIVVVAVVTAAPGAIPLLLPMLLAGALGQVMLCWKTWRSSLTRLRDAKLAGAPTGGLWVLASAAVVVGLLGPLLFAAIGVFAFLAGVVPLHC